jgi:hypothetical protein
MPHIHRQLSQIEGEHMPRNPKEGADQQTVIDPNDPALTDEELDETVPGGAYIVNEVPVDADGLPLEAPPDPPITYDAPDATAEQKAEALRQKQEYEQKKLKYEENKRNRDKWEKDQKERDDKERDQRKKAEQLPAEKRG